MTATAAAGELGTTRNALIGAMNRHGLGKETALALRMSDRPVDRLAAASGCRWPNGDPQSKEFSYCGAEVHMHEFCKEIVVDSYCLEHLRAAYRWTFTGSP